MSIAQTIPTPTAPIQWRHLRPIAAAAAKLDTHRDHLSKLCREKLAGLGLAHFGTHPDVGGQPQWWVHVDHDPRLIDGPAGDDWQDPDLSAFTQRQRDEALQRRVCVEELAAARTHGSDSAASIVSALIERLRERFPRVHVSRTRLYAWSKLYRRPADLPKLIDQRGGNRRGHSDPAAWDYFRDLYLHENRPSIRQCWKETERTAKEKGWRWLKLDACRGQLNDRIPCELQAFHRTPKVWRQQLSPFIAQDPESWRAGELWIGDHKELDVLCRWGKSIVRPWVTAWMDWRTRKVVGYVVSDNPNSSTILAALRHGLLDPANFGGPRCVWIDNGRDYDAWLFHGQTKTQRRQSIKETVKVDEGRTLGIFKPLRIEAHFATPFNPNGKARLERWFRTLEDFCKAFDTYTGNSPDVKPERLKEILTTPHRIPTFEQIKTRIVDQIAGYNGNDEHARADLTDEGGKPISPAAALSSWCDTRRIPADAKALDLLLMNWHRPVLVTRNGISIGLSGETLHYGQNEPALSRFKALKQKDRTPVHVSYDPHDLRTIRVYDDQWKYVCTATMNQTGGGTRISQEHVATLNREKASYAKAIKHVSQNSITRIFTTEEQLAHVADRDGRPTPTPTPEPSSLQIIRTPLDGQAKAIEQEQMRKAVGAESSTGKPFATLDDIRKNLRRPTPSGQKKPTDFLEKMRERNHVW
jgi:putative transposase